MSAITIFYYLKSAFRNKVRNVKITFTSAFFCYDNEVLPKRLAFSCIHLIKKGPNF